MGVTVNITKTLAISPSGRAPTKTIIVFLAVVGISIVIEDTGIIVGVPVGSYTLFRSHTLDVVREGENERLARLIVRMPRKQVAMPITTHAASHKTTYLDRGIYSNQVIKCDI